MRSYLACWLIFVVSINHAWGQDPLPIMELYAPDANSVTKISECKNGLINDVDYFTVRGKVNKNGSNADAYKDTNLYLQTISDPTDSRASQCQPDLTVCGSNFSKDCYCESKDANGDYHIVMTIMAKSIYSGGKLILSWNDARSPFNTPILSNQVDYYPGTISDKVKLTLKIGTTELTLVTGQKVNPDILKNVTSAQLCLENLAGISSFEIKENGNPLAQTTTDSCLTLDFTDNGPSGDWTVSYAESGGCERTGSYTIYLTAGLDCGLEAYQGVLIGIVVILWCAILVILCRIGYFKCSDKFLLKRLMLTVLVLLVAAWLFIIILICIKQTCKPECGFEGYEIALLVIMWVFTVIGVIVVYFKYNKKAIALLVITCVLPVIGVLLPLLLVFYIECIKNRNKVYSEHKHLESELRKLRKRLRKIRKRKEREIQERLRKIRDLKESGNELRQLEERLREIRERKESGKEVRNVKRELEESGNELRELEKRLREISGQEVRELEERIREISGNELRQLEERLREIRERKKRSGKEVSGNELRELEERLRVIREREEREREERELEERIRVISGSSTHVTFMYRPYRLSPISYIGSTNK